jgi:DNA-binding transcriptional MocR family regulator
MKLKLLHSTSSISIVNEAVANFLKSGKYEKHLQQLRRTLQNNYQNYIQTIAESFPEGTKISRPQGGLSLWIEFDKKIRTTELYDLAIKQNISIAPGRMFTFQDQFENCMRLCIGLPWSEDTQAKLRQVGQLAKKIYLK